MYADACVSELVWACVAIATTVIHAACFHAGGVVVCLAHGSNSFDAILGLCMWTCMPWHSIYAYTQDRMHSLYRVLYTIRVTCPIFYSALAW